jgi:hypothetical protein
MPWYFRPDGSLVEIEGFVVGARDVRLRRFFPGDILPPYTSLHFEAQLNSAEAVQLFWQVVNTGDEAVSAGCLRGQMEHGARLRPESTLYRGDHSIECFVVKHGICVARSGLFEVKIR